MKEVKVEPVPEVNLTAQQKARLDVLSAKEEATLTSAEKRELEDIKADSKLVAPHTVGYSKEGDATVYVLAEPTHKTKLKVHTGPALANVENLSASDFDKRFEV